MNFLSGAKTYIIAGTTLVLVGLHVFGIDIPGMNYTILPEIGTLVAVFFARQGATADAAKALAASSALRSDSPTMSVEAAHDTITATK